MSMNLDKSLDEILSTRRDTTRRGRGRGGRRGTAAGRKATVAPSGGVGKNTRNSTRPGPKASVPNGPVSASGESKIIVSNLVCYVFVMCMMNTY